VVLHMDEPPAEPQRQQALEMAVRMDVRKGDVPARLGETTFAVLLPDTDQTAVIVAARLQRAVSNITGRSVSTGVAYYPEDATTASELLQTASGRGS
jgi:GGDEF domain-containing protein